MPWPPAATGPDQAPESFTTERYPDPDWDALAPLQDLADRHLIEVRTVWCSEKGILPAGGHFCGADASHVPDTFAVVTTPPLSQQLRRKQVPVTLTLPLRTGPGPGERD